MKSWGKLEPQARGSQVGPLLGGLDGQALAG